MTTETAHDIARYLAQHGHKVTVETTSQSDRFAVRVHRRSRRDIAIKSKAHALNWLASHNARLARFA